MGRFKCCLGRASGDGATSFVGIDKVSPEIGLTIAERL